MTSETGDTKQDGEEAAETAPVPVCPACGAAARRRAARFCATCGRSLEGQYLPADALRASYHLHRGGSGRKSTRIAPPVSKKRPMSNMLPQMNRNGASTTALAFTTYALVPFLGILFVPGAVLIGAVGLAYSYHAPQRGGRRASFASMVLGLVILGVQVVLWWVIIKVPEWSNPGMGGY